MQKWSDVVKNEWVQALVYQLFTEVYFKINDQ